MHVYFVCYHQESRCHVIRPNQGLSSEVIHCNNKGI